MLLFVGLRFYPIPFKIHIALESVAESNNFTSNRLKDKRGGRTSNRPSLHYIRSLSYASMTFFHLL
jgi:hypothetical protein